MLFDLTANSNTRKVMVLDPSFPKDVTVNVSNGETKAIFQAVVAEDGRPKEYTYQWYVNDAAVEGATGATYERDVSNDKGVYSVFCDVTNKAGTVRTRNAALTVKKLPALDSALPTDATITVLYPTTLNVTITDAGYPDSYTYQWYVDGQAVEGQTGASFEYTPQTLNAKSVYCAVTNEAGTANSRTATVTVNEDRLYFYNRGDFASSGGFASGHMTTFNSDHIYLYGITSYQTFILSYNPVPLKYKKMIIKGEVLSQVRDVCFQGCGLFTSGATGTGITGSHSLGWSYGTVGNFTKTVDISGVNSLNSRYVGIQMGLSEYCRGNIYEIYFTTV